MFLLLFACATEPAPPDPVVAQVQQSVQSGQATAPWLRTGAPTAAPAAPATTSPRAAADALFNDAMRAHELGEPAAPTLLPQALQAYAIVPDLDDDGRFHVAALQLAAGRARDAQATADQVLARQPTHLLALGIAARAASAAGDAAAASGYHQRYRDAYAAEQGARLEYEHHAVLLPIYLQEAGG